MKEMIKRISLSNQFLVSILSIILLLAVMIYVQGHNIIVGEIFERNQQRVVRELNVMEAFIENIQNEMSNALKYLDENSDLAEARNKMNVDYLEIVNGISGIKTDSSNVRKAVQNGDSNGFRAIQNINTEYPGLHPVINMKYVPDWYGEKSGKLEKCLVMESARRLDEKGEKVLLAGKIINGNNDIVDYIRDRLFGKTFYEGKPVGTVTIFLDGTRIATNVIDESGNRALGTVVSKEVFDNVVKKEKIWRDRAYVVTDWYLTAYQPVRDVEGKTIGILYVGRLEKPLLDQSHKLLYNFMGIILFSVFIAVVLTFVVKNMISKPVNQLMSRFSDIGHGNLEDDVRIRNRITEFEKLAESIENMRIRLRERDHEVKSSNGKLVQLNKDYLDLISFVSHELKGILSSTIMNAYTVRDGYLGMVNFKQRKALDSIARNLDHLEATVKNFLNLSRIEKNEIRINKQQVSLKELIDICFQTFQKAAESRNMKLIDQTDPSRLLNVDPDMFLVVLNNLISNAVKYGKEGGNVILTCADSKDVIEIYNDGVPIKEDEMQLLFKKFSRLPQKNGQRQVKGTGLGLFITMEIIKSHCGFLTVYPEESGNRFSIILNKGGEGFGSFTDNQEKAS